MASPGDDDAQRDIGDEAKRRLSLSATKVVQHKPLAAGPGVVRLESLCRTRRRPAFDGRRQEGQKPTSRLKSMDRERNRDSEQATAENEKREVRTPTSTTMIRVAVTDVDRGQSAHCRSMPHPASQASIGALKPTTRRLQPPVGHSSASIGSRAGLARALTGRRRKSGTWSPRPITGASSSRRGGRSRRGGGSAKRGARGAGPSAGSAATRSRAGRSRRGEGSAGLTAAAAAARSASAAMRSRGGRSA